MQTAAHRLATHGAATAESTARVVIDFDALPDGAYMSIPAVADLLDISVNTAWRWIREGRLPSAVKLGPNCTKMQVGIIRQHLAKVAA